MKSSTALKHAAEIIPDIFGNAISFIKARFETDGKEISEVGSVGGFLLKLFAKPVIEKYLESQESKKLHDFGSSTYLYAALTQAQLAILAIESYLPQDYDYSAIISSIDKSSKELNVNSNTVILVFQPQYHPLIVYVREFVNKILANVGAEPDTCLQFLKKYNEGIQTIIQDCFGSAYEKHLRQIEKFLFTESETKLLTKQIVNGKIGFKENESLTYEETYATWEAVEHLFHKETKKDDNRKQNRTNIKLEKLTDIIEQYFAVNPDNHLNKILFIVADFGKGKSVFLKHYAASLSKSYLENRTGLFPIYFNLKDFKRYQSDHKYGVIAEYLETEFGIRIEDPNFIDRTYTFLLDSLDESGELTSTSINRVIDSIKRIQNLDKTKYRTNRIVVTSRPFDEGLKSHLDIHDPYSKRYNKMPINFYVSIFGFTEYQFNNWLVENLKACSSLPHFSSGILKDILDAITKNDKIDIHSLLVGSGFISIEELKRPIFAYMLYQLIINGIDFSKIGKIGVYLSFLNLLTREAKYIYDVNYKINLTEQFNARNILHAISAVWLYNRHNSKVGIKKADVCRFIEGITSIDTDEKILEKYKNSKVNELEFLSHSYFGDSNNILHFQHQSFAEILLAEYYLLLILKYSLDNETNIDGARALLSIGLPTTQTIYFLKDLLALFKESIFDGNKNAIPNEVLEKRKLLAPLLASISLKNNDRLSCNHLHYRWLNNSDSLTNTIEFPIDLLANWPITRDTVEKMSKFCAQILENETNFILVKGEFRISLFNQDLLVTNQSANNLNMDKWIALIVGNKLFNALGESHFNSQVDYKSLINLIKSVDPHSDIYPWAEDLFTGINMRDNEKTVDLGNCRLNKIDFSNSFFRNVLFSKADLLRTNFSNCSFQYCDFARSDLRWAKFSNSRIDKYCGFELVQIYQSVTIPYRLPYNAFQSRESDSDLPATNVSGIWANFGSDTSYIQDRRDKKDIAEACASLLEMGIRNKLWSWELIKSAFVFPTDNDKEEFLAILKGLFHRTTVA